MAAASAKPSASVLLTLFLLRTQLLGCVLSGNLYQGDFTLSLQIKVLKLHAKEKKGIRWYPVQGASQHCGTSSLGHTQRFLE